jgi:hypothetical protein
LKPDILVEYPPAESFPSDAGAGSYAVAYVRPETNTVLYERAIAAAIRGRGDEVIYIANLGGGLIQQDGILRKHYLTQLRFASDPRAEAARYPEIGERLARHFGAPIEKSLIGAFEAAARTPAEELFESFVSAADFLTCWGQQFKRIAGTVVANPGLPAVLNRYTPQANVFVVVVRSADGSPGFFSSLNRAIYQEITSRAETPLVDGERLGTVPWPERVRRTYHLSRTHLMAMFDMADLVYLGEGRRLALADTPLGRSLQVQGAVTAEKLQELRREPLRYARHGDHRVLHYLPLAGEGQGLAWVGEFLRRL